MPADPIYEPSKKHLYASLSASRALNNDSKLSSLTSKLDEKRAGVLWGAIGQLGEVDQGSRGERQARMRQPAASCRALPSCHVGERAEMEGEGPESCEFWAPGLTLSTETLGVSVPNCKMRSPCPNFMIAVNSNTTCVQKAL